MIDNNLNHLQAVSSAAAMATSVQELVDRSSSAILDALPAAAWAILTPLGPDLVAAASSAPAASSAAWPDFTSLDPTASGEGWIATERLPQGWPQDHARVTCHSLAPADGWLVTTGPTDRDETTQALAGTMAAVLGAAVARLEARDDLADLKRRVDSAQQLANMGDYDWHIASDTNTWSDQLYRIYGHQPQSFNASYERFLGLIHPEDRDMIQEVHQQAYASGEPYEMVERIVRPDGETRYLASNGQVIMDESGTPVRMRGTCIDITSRVLAEREGEALSARIREAQVRRRQALEINDNVVQGLAAAVYALDHGDATASATHLRQTLRAARRMMDDLLEPLEGDDLQPGDLVRSTAVSPEVTVELTRSADKAPRPAPARTGGHRVIIADDSADIRYLLATMLELSFDFVVAAQVADGQAAIAAVQDHDPDIVVLDLAMPVLDGFQALQQIRDLAPNAVVVVLSGFNATTMEERALAEGADVYVEKGHALGHLDQILREALRRRRVVESTPATSPRGQQQQR